MLAIFFFKTFFAIFLIWESKASQFPSWDRMGIKNDLKSIWLFITIISIAFQRDLTWIFVLRNLGKQAGTENAFSFKLLLIWVFFCSCHWWKASILEEDELSGKRFFFLVLPVFIFFPREPFTWFYSTKVFLLETNF